MNFSEAESYLYSLGNEVSAMKPGLDAVRALLSALGDPQKNYLKVQVAGTNGKGSVCAFLDSICNAAGIKIGTFTSPHLVSITERVRIDGADISEEDFARHSTVVRVTAEQLVSNGMLESVPTFFEQVTAIGLLAFADAGVEVGILETGLGGRLDATTAANSEIAAITRIDIDHQEYLGETIEQIAAEKAAIIRSDSITIVGGQSSQANNVILERCRTAGVEPRFADFVEVRMADDGSVFLTYLSDYEVGQLGLAGRHQVANAKVTLLVAEELGRRFDVLKAHIVAGLENARHPGRLEYQGQYLFDGAHNVGGAKAIEAYLSESERRPITLVFGAMKDKNVGEIANVLFPHAEKVILTRPDNSRAMSVRELAAHIPERFDVSKIITTENVKEALQVANELSSQEGTILVTGSLYLVGEVKKLLKESEI